MKPDINVADVITAAAGSTLGVLSLLALLLAGLAYAFFSKAREEVRIGIFVLLLGAAIAFGVALMNSARDARTVTNTGKVTSQDERSDKARVPPIRPVQAQPDSSAPLPHTPKSSPRIDHETSKPVESQPTSIGDIDEASHPTIASPAAPKDRQVRIGISVNDDWCKDVRGFNFTGCVSSDSVFAFHISIDDTDTGPTAHLDASKHIVTITATSADPTYVMSVVGSCEFSIAPNNGRSFYRALINVRNTVMRQDRVEYAIDSCAVR